MEPLNVLEYIDDLLPENYQSIHITGLYNDIRSDALNLYNTYLRPAMKRFNTET